MSDAEGAKMTFFEHLVDLRRRLVYSFYGIMIGFAVAYGFSEEIYEILIQPLCAFFPEKSCPVVFTTVFEPFMVYLKVGIVGGLFLAIPWIFLQIWLFLSPGLKASEKRWAIPFVLSASVMFVGGAMVGYFFIFPFAFEYFLQVAPPEFRPMLGMSDYLGFSIGLLFAFGALFEIPVIVILLNLIGVLPAATLWRTWRYAVIGVFVLAAILTPADPYTMLLLAIPLTVLYFAALIICSILEKSRVKPS